jgi:hypothetical protein
MTAASRTANGMIGFLASPQYHRKQLAIYFRSDAKISIQIATQPAHVRSSFDGIPC